MRIRTILFLAGAGLSGACNSDDAYCAKYVECVDEDATGEKLDDDALDVCKEQLRVQRDILAANKGETCKKLQQHQDEWRACMVAIESCDDFNDELQQPDKCESEAEDLNEFAQDNAAKCFAPLSPEPEGGEF